MAYFFSTVCYNAVTPFAAGKEHLRQQSSVVWDTFHALILHLQHIVEATDKLLINWELSKLVPHPLSVFSVSYCKPFRYSTKSVVKSLNDVDILTLLLIKGQT